MKQIHPTAVIDAAAEIADDVTVGPYAVIEGDVSIGRGTVIESHACIKRRTSIGENNRIHAGAVLGDLPQSLSFKDVPTFLRIGAGNTFREHVTVHRAMVENEATVIGDHNYFMALSHAGHDCVIGNRVIVTSCALIAGHTVVEDNVVISGAVVIHQFSRIGRLAMLSGLSAVNRDIPPFVIAGGRPAAASGLNVVGLRRAGVTQAGRTRLKEAFKTFYASGLNASRAIEEIEKGEMTPEVRHFVEFIRRSTRGVCRYAEWAEKRGADF
ncbi:MAG: acyl-ACP--UDP-N-acetylglucosamine O-acyltransferase [Candidatus Aureabacteria bacterium]|nr:acyl-ACP--UDP-N-acetylglucosamine O-acyltransferase [Candidatus Auribacterota bacterium]NLW94463.1 acyl-ACP--UDP-N-acetylglucosamine O-acyltransferase [Chlamydiota bacterium]HOE26595.1 acyl-ACP--UDP-N-acetylglucosamine O-acyltransferase [bacterium]HQM52156.1 acyl-ACP--UDP-N-acetylglucosamine O-acyltransferase [bacterium]